MRSQSTRAPATPRSLGYAMPAEWTPHEATWLAWPHDPVTWPERVPQVERAYVQMIRALAPHERVELLVKDAETRRRAHDMLKAAGVHGGVRIHDLATADSWIRDFGPTFVRDAQGDVAMVDWRFNAWGNKYETLLRDDGVPPRLESIVGCRRFEVDVVMEGGSIEVNGAGTVLTTEQCLLNPNRNPHLDRSRVEAVLRENLGVDQVLWLKEGIVGDDTDGHIDDLARFVDPTTLVAAVEEDPGDENHAILQDNLGRLRGFRDPSGRPFRVVALPMPGRVGDAEGRLPASYANFYIGNGAVLLPVFGHPNDARAEKVLKGLFPRREIVPIRCEDLVWGMGTLHCVTQQQPAKDPGIAPRGTGLQQEKNDPRGDRRTTNRNMK
jgi:agmatine deiminase